MDQSIIQQWYKGRNIFITGGTGYMGKVLLEKILRSLPDVGNIYVLVRPKRGLTPTERLEKIKGLPVFSRLRDEKPEALNKLIIVEGSLSEENLGLDETSLNTLAEEVSVVFHMAATLRLEAEVKEAVIANTLGTVRVMELCQKMKKIESVVHLSTAFCHCDITTLEEKVYKSSHDPYDIINLVQSESDEVLKMRKLELIAPHPNSYTFSKRLAEVVVEGFRKSLPVAIARPSVVLPAMEEPVPGWVDSLNGPTGVMVAAGKGVLRSMLCKGDYNAEVVAVDIAINGLIFWGYYRGITKAEDVLVINITAPRNLVNLTWNEVVERGRKIYLKYPFEWMLWYPGGTITTNFLYHWFVVIMFQWIPALLLDSIFFLLGRERFMIRVQKKILVGVDVLKYFALNKWDFRNEESTRIIEQLLVDNDKKLFKILNVDVDINLYITTMLLGAREFCMKEDPSTLPYTRMHLKALYVLHQFCKYFFLYLIVKYVFRFLGMEALLTLGYWFEAQEIVKQINV